MYLYAWGPAYSGRLPCFLFVQLSWSGQWDECASPSAICMFPLTWEDLLMLPRSPMLGLYHISVSASEDCSGYLPELCTSFLSCHKHYQWTLLASIQPHSSSGRWDLSWEFINKFCLILCSSHHTAAAWKWAFCSENWVEFHSLVLCRRSNKMSITSRKT